MLARSFCRFTRQKGCARQEDSMQKTTLISPDGLLTYFTHIFANSKDMINLFSMTQQKIILWNEASTASMGYTMEDFEAVPLEKRYPPEEFAKLLKCFGALAKEGYAFEKLKMYSKSGELKDLWMRAFVIQTEPEVICLVHTIDVTEEKKREDKAIREAKLASLGEASAVLSHELSNALQLIEFNLSLIEGSPHIHQDISARIGKIKMSISRMSDIITGVMKYSRHSKVQTTAYTSLAATIDDTLSLLRGYLDNKNVSVEVEVPANFPLVKADAGQVQQILLILVKNAAQALIDHPQRKVTFKAFKNGSKIELQVSDTGPGIPKEMQNRIFDAFSTTKPVGLGLGLGLSIAKGLAIKNSIDIQFRSELGKGTTFLLEFEREGYASNGEEVHKRQGVALVVDDNANNLIDTTRCLEHLNIKVLTASSAREALKLILVQKFDYVFCGDAMYPISGSVFAKEARLTFGGLICLIGVNDPSETNYVEQENLFYIKRPFYIRDIEVILQKYKKSEST